MPTKSITPSQIQRLLAEFPTGLASLSGDDPDDHLVLWSALHRGDLDEVLFQFERVTFSITIDGKRHLYRVRAPRRPDR